MESAGGALASPALLGSSRKTAAQRPNFLFILTDDQRWDALSLMGHPCLKTPNMDRIGREGAHFANAFGTTSLCAPSRASFLTGQYARRHGVRDNQVELPPGTVTFATLLQAAGYDTAQIGKWHMKKMAERPGFNYAATFIEQGVYMNPDLLVEGKPVKASGYVTDVLTDYAVEWLSRKRQNPFCMYFGHKASHHPWIAAERHQSACSDAALPNRASAHDTLEGKPEWMKKRANGRWGTIKWPNLQRDYQNYLRTLLAVDESVGRVLDTLERMNRLDSTVIVFAGDNGFLFGDHKLINKETMYEESLRIPLLMRYPALIRPGTVVRDMALNIDMAPTFLELAGVPIPAAVQGRSWAPLFQGKKKKLRTSFLYEYFSDRDLPGTPNIEGVRTERWKYICYPGTREKDELYDLKADPCELRNRAGDPAASSELRILKAELERLRASTVI